MDSKELRKFASECLALALIAATAERAAELRKMAREMLDEANGVAEPASPQQQQIQPDKDEDKPS